MRRIYYWFKELKKGESCRMCGNKIDLQVHHIDENRQNNQMSNLIILCRSCHSKQHRGKEWFEKIRKNLPNMETRKRGQDGKFRK
jgi:5-methylcytosine-specific restriction endonuclease McrA